MKTLSEIKSAVTHLPNREYSRFRKWFDEFEAKQWDKRIINDAKAGKLSKISQKALKDYHAGRASSL